MFPFLQTFILRDCRRRQRSRATTFLRIYGIISSLALISLKGFRVTRSRISLELSSLGERRVRNQELVILRKKEKEPDMTYKSTESKENKKLKFLSNQATYLWQGVARVEEVRYQIWDFFLLGESSKRPH
jgi:hypothetical protein